MYAKAKEDQLSYLSDMSNLEKVYIQYMYCMSVQYNIIIIYIYYIYIYTYIYTCTYHTSRIQSNYTKKHLIVKLFPPNTQNNLPFIRFLSEPCSNVDFVHHSCSYEPSSWLHACHPSLDIVWPARSVMSWWYPSMGMDTYSHQNGEVWKIIDSKMPFLGGYDYVSSLEDTSSLFNQWTSWPALCFAQLPCLHSRLGLFRCVDNWKDQTSKKMVCHVCLRNLKTDPNHLQTSDSTQRLSIQTLSTQIQDTLHHHRFGPGDTHHWLSMSILRSLMNCAWWPTNKWKKTRIPVNLGHQFWNIHIS